jgi:hypothetical protein
MNGKGKAKAHVRSKSDTDDYLCVSSEAPPSYAHSLKSIGCWHFLQMCSRLNSSEKISFSAPQWWHLQINDFKFLKDSNPGQ